MSMMELTLQMSNSGYNANVMGTCRIEPQPQDCYLESKHLTTCRVLLSKFIKFIWSEIDQHCILCNHETYLEGSVCGVNQAHDEQLYLYEANLL